MSDFTVIHLLIACAMWSAGWLLVAWALHEEDDR